MKEKLPPNQERHLKNLFSKEGLDKQFYHGTYYIKGVPQVNKDKRVEKTVQSFPREGTIFEAQDLDP